MERILILRHARTAWNAERRFQGQADPPLDDVGRAQAYEVSALIAAFRPALIVSSDAQRAVYTAEPVAGACGLEVVVDKRLRERSLGHWEGLTREEVHERFPDEFADWRAGRDVSRRGGETRKQVADRAMEMFAELPDVDVVTLVTHSATAMALVSAILGLSHEVHVLGPLANCHWSELVWEEERWRLRAHNVGSPGPVIPLLTSDLGEDDAADAHA